MAHVMNENHINEKVAVLKARMDLLEQDRAAFRLEWREDTKTIKTSIAELKTMLDKHVPCPAPGMCIGIGEKVEEIQKDYEERIRALEDDKNKMIGERTIIGIVCTAIGVGVTSVVSYLTSKH